MWDKFYNSRNPIFCRKLEKAGVRVLLKENMVRVLKCLIKCLPSKNYTYIQRVVLKESCSQRGYGLNVPRFIKCLPSKNYIYIQRVVLKESCTQRELCSKRMWWECLNAWSNASPAKITFQPRTLKTPKYSWKIPNFSFLAWGLCRTKYKSPHYNSRIVSQNLRTIIFTLGSCRTNYKTRH